MASTGISISMQAIAKIVDGKDFAALAGSTIAVPGQKAFKLDADAQKEILKQGIYRYLYLPLYSKRRAAKMAEAKRRTDAKWQSLLARAKKLGMSDAEIAAIEAEG